MERKKRTRVNKLIKSRRRRQLMKRLVFSMACIVVFCTTYALILPAIAMTPNTYCGFEEHTHTEECYEKNLICERHGHTEECYSDVSEAACGYEETEGHTHSEGCYAKTVEYGCGLEESAGHVHDSSCCQTYTECVCGQNEYEGHYHTDSCYDEDWNLICGQGEYDGHYHDDSCYYTYEELVCSQSEYEGHTHSDGCLVEVETLVCGQEAAPAHHHDSTCFVTRHNAVCDYADENHVHTDSCYEMVLKCELEEHTHEDACYSDPEADLETEAQWTKGLPTLTGNWSEDLVEVAKTQIGYKESAKNFEVVDSVRKGITRYGIWYGTPYEDWSAMFASFCLNYAQVANVTFNNDVAAWVMDFSKADSFAWAADYTPVKGDIIFFDINDDGAADHCGIVTACDGAKIWTIEGDDTDKVKEESYSIYDKIYGYGILPKNPAFAEEEHEAAAEAENEIETAAEAESSTEASEEENVSESEVQEAEEQSSEENEQNTAEAESLIEEVIESAEAESTIEEIAEVESAVEEIEMTESLTSGPEEVAEVESTVEDIIDPDARTEKTCVGEDYIVTVSYTAAAEIPDNAELWAEEYAKDSEHYLQRYAEAAKLNDWKDYIDHTSEFRLFNIGLYVDDVEIEPKAAVDVKITYPSQLTTAAEEALKKIEAYETAEGTEPVEFQVLHFEEEDATFMDVNQVNDGDREVMEFTTDSFSDYGIMPSSYDPSRMPAGKYGPMTLSYNYDKNAFLTDPTYSKFYNEYSPLGIAGSFHIVAFDSADLVAHTNGNVLAKTVYATSNFGTNNLTEVSYIQNYLQINEGSGSTENSYLVLGSDTTLVTMDNGQSLGIMSTSQYGTYGVKISKPRNIVQDQDTATKPFIDIDAVEAEIKGISASLASYPSTPGADVNLAAGYINIAQPDGATYVNITADQLSQVSNGLAMKGFQSGHSGSLIINVDCSNKSGIYTFNVGGNGALAYVDGQQISTSEITEFSNGKVIWNFINTNNVTEIEVGQTWGAIIAPYTNVRAIANVNGTIIGQKVYVNAETHRTDFTGTTVPGNALIYAKKTVNGKVPTFEEVFTFQMEEYNRSTKKWSVKYNDIHNSGSVINFPTLTFNQEGTYWYRISEVEDSALAAKGYIFDPKKYIVEVTVTKQTSGGNTKYIATSKIYEAEELYDDGWNIWPIDRGNKCATTNDPHFKNYTPVEEVLEACKTVTGTELGNNKFTFELRKAELNNLNLPVAQTGADALIETVTNNGSLVQFSPLKYSIDDAGKQFWYEVTEKADATMEANGWTFDTTKYYCRVEVQESSDGGLVTTKTWYDANRNPLGSKPGFVNDYKEKTGIEVDKKWFNADGDDVTETTMSGEIEFELFQKKTLKDDPYTVLETNSLGKYKISSADGWKKEFPNLPKDGSYFETKYGDWYYNWETYRYEQYTYQVEHKFVYTYYVVETGMINYTTEYENNDGISTGTITIKNKLVPQYVLPETGGPGTRMYMIFGMMLMAMSVIILGFNSMRRCERRVDE